MKPAWIGQALKKRPCWEGQTRLILSVFCMLSFQASLKRKPKKGLCFKTDNFFRPWIKKPPTCITWTQIKISGISEKQRNWAFLSIFSKRNIFLHFKTTIAFFDFILQFWRSATLLTQTCYLLFQVALCNQPTVVLRHWKWHRTRTFKPYCIPLWTIGFSNVT